MKVFQITLPFLLLVFCTDPKKGISKKQLIINEYNNDSTLLTKDLIPVKGDTIVKKYREILQIKQFNGNKNAISLRLWCDLTDTTNLFDIEITDTSFFCNYTSFGFSINKGNVYLKIFKKVNFPENYIKAELLDSLRNNYSNYLAKEIYIPENLNVFADGGDVFTFEVMKNGKYHYLQIIEPCSSKDSNLDCYIICSFLKLIESNFNIKTYSGRSR